MPVWPHTNDYYTQLNAHLYELNAHIIQLYGHKYETNDHINEIYGDIIQLYPHLYELNDHNYQLKLGYLLFDWLILQLRLVERGCDDTFLIVIVVYVSKGDYDRYINAVNHEHHLCGIVREV